MRSFLKKNFLVLLGFSLTWLPAYADEGPTEAESSAQAAPAVEEPSALGQFPQAETAPLPQPPQAQEEPPANPSGIDFPKVKTTDDERMARRFNWWPSDARPAPVKDPDHSGYWWWPKERGQMSPWGNQGFIYVRKVIFDYKTSPGGAKPSLVIKKILKNVKVYFDFDKADLREDAREILRRAVDTLQRNPQTDILIVGNADIRGTEQYNLKLGERRATAAGDFFAGSGITSERIRLLSRGKLDALAPADDLVGLQKDRNAQFVIAEVEEVLIPASQASLYGEGVVEETEDIESSLRVDLKEYVIQEGDTLWKIAQQEYGDGRHWKRLYDFNKELISDPNKPKKGTKIRIPIE